MSGRLVPWASWSEWEDVRGLLFADDGAAVQSGLSVVTGWRRRGKLPLGVDITAMLLATSLKDPHGPGPCLPPSQPAVFGIETSLQTEYSLTVIRFVNGVSDSCQKGKIAGSISKNADSAGLHPMLVDVRHEATHNHVPSLHMLRLAASHSLSWLYNNYWAAQSDRAWASASEAVGVLERLLANQSARAAVSAPSGQSSQQSDSDADVSERSEAGMSPAALKKQQKALLGELRPIVPSSHAADLAHILLHSPATYAAEHDASLRNDIAASSALPHLHLSATHSSAAGSLSLLSEIYYGLVSHVIVQSFRILKKVKAAAMHVADVRASGNTAVVKPSRVAQSAAAWAAAALKVSESSDDPAEHQQRLSFALHLLFQPAAVFLASPASHKPQASQPPTAGPMDRLQAIHSKIPSHPGDLDSSRAAPCMIDGDGKSGTVRSSEADSNGKSSPGMPPAQCLFNSDSCRPEVTAMLRTEKLLLQMCKEGGDTNTRSRARLVCQLMAAIAGPESDIDEAVATAAAPTIPHPALPNKQKRHRSERRVAAADVLRPPAEDLATPETDAEHAAVLQGIRKHSAAAAGQGRAAAMLRPADAALVPSCAVSGTSGAAKRRRATPTAGSIVPPSVGAVPQARRFKVADSWCTCPIGTLPSGVPLVGVMPDLGPRPPAASEAAAGGLAAEGAVEEPVEAVAAAQESTEGPGGCGRAGAEAAEAGADDACEVPVAAEVDAVAAAAITDVLAALNAAREPASEVAEDEPATVGMGVLYGVLDGPDESTVSDEAVGRGHDMEAGPASYGGADGQDGLVGLRSVVGGVLQDPVCAGDLRERVIRACALVLP